MTPEGAGETNDVIVVSADSSFTTGCERNLPNHVPVRVHTATTVGEAVELLSRHEIDCIVSDHDLPDADGVAFLEVVRAQYPTLPFVLFTSEGSEEFASRAISAGVTEYLMKEHHADQWHRLATLITDTIAYYHEHGDIVDTENRTKTLLDAAHDMIAVVRDGAFEYVNQTGVELLGADTRSAVVDRPIEGILPGNGPDSFASRLALVETGEESLLRAEEQLLRDDGTSLPVTVTASHISWMNRPAATLVIRDISERKEDKYALRRFRRAVEAAGQAIHMTDADGTIQYVNPAFEEITGFSSDEAIGRNSRIFNSGEMPEGYYEELWERLRDGDVWTDEFVNRRKTGDIYHARETIAPVTDESGDIRAYVATQTDVTEEREREDRLRQYEHAVEGANDLIGAVDDDYRYLFVNRAYREFHGLEAGDVRGMELSTGIGADAFEEVKPYVDQALAGRSVGCRMTRSRPERPDKTFSIRYYPLEDDTGEVQGAIATLRDLTEQLERETQLTSLDRMLRHNLHNKLNVILGRAEMIEAQAPEEIAQQARAIERAGERVLEQADKEREIVTLLTDLSTPERLDLGETVTAVVERIRAAHPEVDLTLDGVTNTPLWTIPEIERAIEELVENAVLHNDREHPEVRVSVEGAEQTVEVRVSDNGPGIPSIERQVIGDDAPIEPLLHSEGMGLWLVKRIVTRAGGMLDFVETSDRGSTVRVVVPCSGEQSAETEGERLEDGV